MTIPAIYQADEQWEGAEQGANEQGPWARRVYCVPWSQFWPFTLFLRGTASTTGPTGPWIHPIPYQFPLPVAGTTIYAKDVTGLGVGKPIVGSDPLAWEYALVTVVFGGLDWTAQTSDDPFFLNSLSLDATENSSLQFATQEIDFGAEWGAIPGASIKYKTSGAAVTSTVNKRMTVIRMTITWHRYPLMPMTKIRSYADTVNDATFLGCDRGTVMFEGAKTVREMTADGNITQKVQMSLKWRSVDWNKFLLPTGLAYDWIVDKNNVNLYTYPYMDYRLLLL